MAMACGRPQGGGRQAHVNRGGGKKPDFPVDIING